MSKVQVSEATGPVLDWMVNEAQGWGRMYLEHWNKGGEKRFVLCDIMNSPSKNWDQGGPIIERDRIGVCHYNESDGWEVPNWAAWRTDIDDRQMIMGETPLIAAMRCYVASKLGDEVEVPEELLT